MFKVKHNNQNFKISFETFMSPAFYPEVNSLLKGVRLHFGKEAYQFLIEYGSTQLKNSKRSKLDRIPGLKTYSQMVTRVSIWNYETQKEVAKAESKCRYPDKPHKQKGKKFALNKALDQMIWAEDFDSPSDLKEFKEKVREAFFENYPKSR